MVRAGDGGRHRVVVGTRSGTPVGECRCEGYTHHDWCAHLGTVLFAYVREEVVVAVLDAGPDEELAMLWRQYRQGGEA